MTIKAIETRYDGYKFRSRVEARWAVFFNYLNVKFEYEKEGYDLDGIFYLPDFWIESWDVFVEIKGSEPTDLEKEKCRRLNKASGFDVYIFYGQCSKDGHKITLFTNDFYKVETIDYINNIMGENPDMQQHPMIMQCRRCDEICIAGKYTGWYSLGSHKNAEKNNCGDRQPIMHDRVEKAFDKAKKYRFESF